MAERGGLTRRDFLKTGTGLAAGSLLAGVAPDVSRGPAAAGARSRVVLVRRSEVVGLTGAPRQQMLGEMLDQAVTELTGRADPLAAWGSLFRGEDVVGVKSNVWQHLPTPPELEAAIVDRLRAVGVPRQDIGVADRRLYENPLFQRATALLNVRPLRTHHWSGLGTLIKNYVTFVPDPWSYHPNACESLGSIWRRPEVVGRTRLNVLVVLTPQFHGVGPHHFSSAYTWPYGGLLVSVDPVAADSVGARLIEAQRQAHFGKPRPITPPPRHIVAAERKFGLGRSDPAAIDLVRLGWRERPLV